jgi:hypothetical protein
MVYSIKYSETKVKLFMAEPFMFSLINKLGPFGKKIVGPTQYGFIRFSLLVFLRSKILLLPSEWK